MKRILLTAVAGLALIGAGACHKTGSNAGKDLSNPGNSAPVNAAQDVAAGVTGMATSAVASPTTAVDYVPKAAMGDMYEIAAAKIALKRTKSAEIKSLAQMMIKDHTKSTEMVKAAVKEAGLDIAPPAALDARMQGMIDNLNAAGDSDFDLAYLHQQLAAHIEALNLHKTFSEKGDTPALATAAGKIVPVVQMHIDAIKKIGGDKLTGNDTPASSAG